MTIAQQIRDVTKVGGFGDIARSPLLPLVLLLLALSTVFIFAGDRGHFYRPGHHDYTSAEHLTVAVNLSPQHNFARFRPLTLDAEGQPAYLLYGRYPIGGYALAKLATLPFGGSLSAQLYAARTLFLLFFAAGAVLAYLSLSRLASSRWVALTTVLLAFSSFYFLYYNDMINVEVSIDFFGVMLTFHGMVIFMQEGRFRQLLIKTCIALLFGWHVFALLLPFIILGMGSDLIKARASASELSIRSQLMRVGGSLLRSRYLLLGVVSLLFGLCVLGSIFVSEYYALDGDRSLTELPIFGAIVRRTGGDENFTTTFADRLAWRPYLERQFQNIFRMTLPYVFLDMIRSEGGEDPAWVTGFMGAFLGFAAYGACIVGIAFARHKILLATLSSFGFFWTIPMRYNVAFHDFEAWYYGGIPLTLLFLILMYVHKRAGFKRFLIERSGRGKGGREKGRRRRRRMRREVVVPVTAVLSIAAALVFGASSFQMAKANHDPEMARFHEAVIQDFDVIRKITKDKVVFVHQSDGTEGEITRVPHGVDYYLSGRTVVYNHPFHERYKLRKFSDYLVTAYRVDGEALLTPENQAVFLYDRRMYDAEIDRTIRESGDPVFQSNFDVSYDGSTLTYSKEPCDERDTDPQFFLHVYPVDVGALPSHIRQDGRETFHFDFKNYGERTGDMCFAEHRLPPYDVARIHTGQFDSNERIWQGVLDLERRGSRIIGESDDPVFQSNFAVYSDGSTLIYTKESCEEQDAAGRFFLRVYPVDTGDLPIYLRQDGWDRLDFAFKRGGGQTKDRCFATQQLPPYEIDIIYTGQLDRNGVPVWQGVFDLEGRDLDRMIADSGGPAIQSNFNVYLDGNTIIYIRDSCDDMDDAPQLFLHVYPADAGDPPSDRIQERRDNFSFDFIPYGWNNGGRCFAARQLPPYEINRIHTGQFDSNGRIWQGVLDAEGRGLARMIEDSGGPAIQSNFDVYLDGDTIIYTRESCDDRDVAAQFFVHVYPADASDLLSDRRQEGRDILDFDFNTYGWQSEDGCFAARQLPSYEIDRIHTGQFDSNRRIWQGVLDGEGRGLDRMIEDSGGPAIQSNFNVYLDGSTIIYTRDPCDEGDAVARFFLHVYPVDAAGLPSDRRQEGRDNLDFDFNTYGWKNEDGCFATRQLPSYEIDRIHTGQFDSNGRIWEGEFDGERKGLDRMIEDSGGPAIQSNFNVYLDGSTIIYTRDPCDEGDAAARFFLHVYPVDAGDLPSDRRQEGRDILDFDFNAYGWKSGDRCFATRQLPPYEIDRIHTGQFDSNGRIWEGEFDAAGIPPTRE